MLDLISILRKAFALDVVDLSYLYQPHHINITLLPHVGQPRPGIFIRIGSFLWRIVCLIKHLPKSMQMPSVPKGVPLFFVTTNNQTVTLLPIAESMNNANLIGINGFGNHQLPLLPAYILSLMFFPVVLAKFIQSRDMARQSFRYVFDAYWLSYGYYIFLCCLLKKIRPSILIMANDHIMWTRTFLRAAKDENIQTIYFQHASVTDRFPPLEFDYALLDGLDAAHKYAECGKSLTKVLLIGIPRFDRYYASLNLVGDVKTIGICVGLLNSLEEVKSIMLALNTLLQDINFLLRPHPGDDRCDEWEKFAVESGWSFSNGKEENTFGFLSRVDAILAGDSNILLEAVLMNVVGIYYDFSGKKLDWYGFCENGLVDYFSNPNDLVEHILKLKQARPSVRIKAKRYCATINTPYDGQSTRLAEEIISKILSQNLDLTNWKRSAQISNLSVYEVV